ncbi:hypothetical protein BX661DRAFT_179578 [Kickxella alabastrina]|uniref:uncharacterized protein n=1 Tax=Kickxella alabastrina TaxID=61397 RepID=UPI002220E391|nr:uncharacterized protein BX661DRAFT_179578 [Kickxella alabastrina]KAI7831963.1 hypothetical protein BX661DRAFT_179578 [Kickxella alabastrina]
MPRESSRRSRSPDRHSRRSYRSRSPSRRRSPTRSTNHHQQQRSNRPSTRTTTTDNRSPLPAPRYRSRERLSHHQTYEPRSPPSRRDTRKRSKSPETHRPLARDSRSKSPERQMAPKLEEEVGISEEALLEMTEEEQMNALLGFGGFDTTKGKKVSGNDIGAANVKKQRKFRQYMNRKGGFNRLLDKQ